jgi:hypothetical protein
MKYYEYLQRFVGTEGGLYYDQGIFNLRIGPVDVTKSPLYRITEVHEDFVVVESEKAEIVKAENLTYALPLTNFYLVMAKAGPPAEQAEKR